MGNGIVIPPLWCPLDLHVRAGAAEFQAHSQEWVRRHGLDDRSLRRAAATDTGFLACTWAVEGTDEGVQILSDWLMWALLFDDYYCDTGPHCARPASFNPLAGQMMARALHPDTAPTGDSRFDAYASALTDLFRRIHVQADPHLAQLCALAHFRWAVGAMCGVSDRAAGALRTGEEHLLIRPMDGGDLISAHMIEVAEGTVLPAAERIRADVRALEQAAGILLTVPTDLASYAHEQHQDCLESNLVHILAAQNSTSAQAAAEEACAVLETVMEFFVAMRRQFRTTGTPTLRRYADQLAHLVRGSYEWQRFLPRYTTVLDVPEDVGPDAPVPRVTMALHEIARTRRCETSAQRPSSLSWWWDLLPDSPAPGPGRQPTPGSGAE